MGIGEILKLIWLCLVCLIIYATLAFIYRSGINSDGQKISFKQFINLSAIAPEKWTFNHYGGETSVYYNHEHIWMKSYYDQIRLYWFVKNITKHKTNIAITKKRAELLTEWQKDINKFYEQETELLNGLKGKVS